ncbi:hypothetical protein MA16_Dca003701 [Dendrobium catenatum]|uniref:Uncharacterized protein n=1 Tax=Dendrobium catenatum TaxID=906689 RepID=A0A2I0WFR7_9ASPA|nr:hypothetical protein MA16_Dca003701 [Dendrobium catenatum]
MAGKELLFPVVTIFDNQCASPLINFPCSNQEDCEGINKDLANNLSLIPAYDYQLVVSLVLVEKASKENDCHDNFDDANVGFCDVNNNVVKIGPDNEPEEG